MRQREETEMSGMKMAKAGSFLAAGLVGLMVSAARGADFHVGPRLWVNTTQTYTYYLHNNFNTNGNLMSCYLNNGPVEFDKLTGDTVHAITNVTTKSSMALGGYIFSSGPQATDASFVRRMDTDWDTNSIVTFMAVDENGSNVGPSSICTDGTNLYTCSYYAAVTTNRHVVNAYSVANEAGSFTLTHLWSTPLGTSGIVRGFGYANGYLYASPAGGGSPRRLYAIKAADGTATDLGVEVPGSGSVYDVVRQGNLLIVAAAADLFVWDMTSDTSVDADSVDQYGTALFGAGHSVYGVSFDGVRLYLASGSGTSHLQAFLAGPMARSTIIKGR